jgi:hypothetical protein
MTPEEGGVPGGDAEAHVDEEVKVPSPASVPGETKDVGTDRKRENSPEIERGDFKRSFVCHVRHLTGSCHLVHRKGGSRRKKGALWLWSDAGKCRPDGPG